MLVRALPMVRRLRSLPMVRSRRGGLTQVWTASETTGLWAGSPRLRVRALPKVRALPMVRKMPMIRSSTQWILAAINYES